MEVAGLAGEGKEAERGIVLRAIDKIDRLGPEGVRALLGEGRKDESGDFTKGAGLSAEQAEVVMGFVNSSENTKATLANDVAHQAKEASYLLRGASTGPLGAARTLAQSGTSTLCNTLENS